MKIVRNPDLYLYHMTTEDKVDSISKDGLLRFARPRDKDIEDAMEELGLTEEDLSTIDEDELDELFAINPRYFARQHLSSTFPFHDDSVFFFKDLDDLI
ncbi:unnamed protein product, partial [marine sediment metagenome]